MTGPVCSHRDFCQRLLYTYIVANILRLHTGHGFMYTRGIGAASGNRGVDSKCDAQDFEAWRAHIQAMDGAAYPEGFAGAIKALPPQ